MDATEQDILGRCAAQFGFALDVAALNRIDRFVDLLLVWNSRLRLTGERDVGTIVRKHVADAFACVPLMPDDGGRVLDLGTGAGLPGGVVSCVRPDLAMTLLDARERPVSFLSEAIRTVPLPRARAVQMRAEEAARDAEIGGRQQVVTSRAVRMDLFLGLAKPLLAERGKAVSMQTPKTDAATAQTVAAAHGLSLLDVRDYRLPDGEPRRLVVFG